MVNLSWLDTWQKVVSLIVGIGVLIGMIWGGLSYLHLGPHSNDSTPPKLPYTTTVSDGNTILTSDSGFRITYPANMSFISDTNSSSNPEITIFLSPFEHYDKVSIQTDDKYTSSHVTLHDVAVDYSHNARFLASNGLTTENTSVSLGGQPAYKIEFSQQQLVEANENHSVLVMWVFGLHSDRVYSVRYSALVLTYYEYLPEVQKIIDSFRYT